MNVQRFQGADRYVATDDLRIATNAAITLERPLLIKGKPGTGEPQLLGCLKPLLNEDVPLEVLKECDPIKLISALHGAMLKNEQDVNLFERLAFLSRRESRN